MSRGHGEQVLLSVAFQSPDDQVFPRRLVFSSPSRTSLISSREFIFTQIANPLHCYSNSNFENLSLFLSSSDMCIIGLESKSEVLIYEATFHVRLLLALATHSNTIYRMNHTSLLIYNYTFVIYAFV